MTVLGIAGLVFLFYAVAVWGYRRGHRHGYRTGISDVARLLVDRGESESYVETQRDQAWLQ